MAPEKKLCLSETFDCTVLSQASSASARVTPVAPEEQSAAGVTEEGRGRQRMENRELYLQNCKLCHGHVQLYNHHSLLL